MIVGIVLTVLLGGIALVQTVRLRRSQLRADAMQWAGRKMIEDRNNRRDLLISLGTEIERAYQAILTGDGPGLHEAIREANRLMEGRPERAA